MLEVTAMQQIFYTPVPPEEYARLGKDFPFPQPTLYDSNWNVIIFKLAL
ncbi:hypothetical protein [Desulfofundulus thermosubterraneus]|nr:hypothetical protein [Desulfofundulus thermosubterraneus]